MLRLRPISVLPLAVALAACGGAGSPASASPPSSHAEHETPPASSASSAAPSGDATGEPSDAAVDEPFTCDLPVTDPGSAPIANIVDIRAATHDGYDRLVFEFEQGTPELSLERAEPPFTHDASGLPIEIEGESFLGLVMRGGTKQTDAGTSSYGGPTEFSLDFHSLRHAVEGGDFERQSTWYFGLAEEECARVLVLEDPPRIAIDVEH